jgi:ubiquinone/menaquinone biosynthesis C-methylase UbiE
MKFAEVNSFDNIDQGFSSIYEQYEKLSTENYIDIARRKTIRTQVDLFLKPNDKILEINAGSGIDAVYFAQKGHQILATDISTGAENYINSKIKKLGLNNLKFQKASFTNLLDLGKFNHIFSNYGGLNCIDNLDYVCKSFEELLHPKGYVTLVIMPPFYPWELATVLKGNKNAFRRFQKNGTIANVENHTIKTFYYTPNQIKKSMGKNFKKIKTANIGTFYPSSHYSFFDRYKSTITKLIKFDNWINQSPYMPKGVGDYFMITFQKIN